MKVKFTNPLNKKEVLFGTIVEFLRHLELFVIQGDKGGRYMINPNSDYNFRFIPNEEADRRYAISLNAIADELDALEKKAKKSC